MLDRKWLGTVFKALSDLTRLRMIRLLTTNDVELCVCEFVDCLQERQYTVSRGLRLLEQAGLVEAHKRGRWVYYSLVGKGEATPALLHELVASVSGDKVFSLDQSRFNERIQLREEGRCCVGIQTRQLAGQ